MRALLVILIALCGAARAQGFDHNLHERDLFTSGGQPLACTKCHAMQNGLLTGRPDHAACFGACHGAPPAKGKRGATIAVQPICTNCHASDVLAKPFDKKLPAEFPPYVPTDFALAANHASHAKVACAQCHLATKVAPHRRCASCHDGGTAAGKAFAMTTCQPCHTPGSGSPRPPELAEPQNTVTAAGFSHARHAQRGGKGADCITCHADIAKTNDNILPRTPATACAIAGCHDGAPVFSITASCTRCHTTTPPKYDLERRDTRFSHATHEDSGLACSGCHPLGKANEVVTSGHAPCVTCHAEDFTRRDPLYCFACHNSTEPWRKLTADRGPPDRTEFGATLDHSRPAHQKPCASCHSLTTASAQLRPPRGHSACTASGCHATASGPEPRLASCEGCHQRSLAAKRAAQRLSAAWSVRATFQHATHVRDKEGRELACSACHGDIGAGGLAAIPTPPKSTCVPCHDGRTAFKLTGTTCNRCHPGEGVRPSRDTR